MKSCCYRAEILHRRLQPREHQFRYHCSVVAVDIDEVDRLSSNHSWFGLDRPAPVSLRKDDYLGGGSGPWREKLNQILAERGHPAPTGSVVLVTSPRFLGYVFNPVNFWIGYDREDNIEFVVAEVNNTFGERHLYLLSPGLESRSAPCQENTGESPRRPAEFSCPKSFYVSPFFEVEGQYRFQVQRTADRLSIAITAVRDSTVIFESHMRGSALPFSLAGLLASHPWTIFLTQPRIHWQAFRLYWSKKIPLVPRPRPLHPDTIQKEPPSWLHRQAVALVHRLLAKAGTFVVGEPQPKVGAGCSGGCVGTSIIGFETSADVAGLSGGVASPPVSRLEWTLPNGQTLGFGAGPGRTARLRLWNWDLYFRLLWSGDVAFGDGFVDGDWESEDTSAVMGFFAHHRDSLDDRQLGWLRRLGQQVGRLQEWVRRNSLSGSRENIKAHYDLSNHLYSNFLDSQMVYSCAIFQEGDDLERAQQRKLDRLLALAEESGPAAGDDHLDGPGRWQVLEIGSGWGALSRLLGQRGCRVVGLTLSQEQLEWSCQQALEQGLQSKLEYRLQDYRQVDGVYDRIFSCEMLEAVGAEYLGLFFQRVQELLRPGGIAVLQVITFPDRYYQEYRHSQDWIQKRIFPGGHCPSLNAIRQAIQGQSQLQLARVESIGRHYVPTLQAWRQRLESNWDKIQATQPERFDERFRRTWNFYFSYCEAGFATDYLDVHHLVLKKETL